MGLFSRLVGWDQVMAAVNAVMANYVIERASEDDRKLIASEVISIVKSGGSPRIQPDAILLELSQKLRVVQTNFISLACTNLGIEPPFSKSVWSHVKNPYLLASIISEERIAVAVDSIEKENGIKASWPGNDVRIDFRAMLYEGALTQFNEGATTYGEKIIVTCPDCHQKLNIPKGKDLLVQCVKCGRKFNVYSNNAVEL